MGKLVDPLSFCSCQPQCRGSSQDQRRDSFCTPRRQASRSPVVATPTPNGVCWARFLLRGRVSRQKRRKSRKARERVAPGQGFSVPIVLNDGTVFGMLPYLDPPAQADRFDLSLFEGLPPIERLHADLDSAFIGVDKVAFIQLASFFARDPTAYIPDADKIMASLSPDCAPSLRDHLLRYLVWKCINASTIKGASRPEQDRRADNAVLWMRWLMQHDPPLDHHAPVPSWDIEASPRNLEYPRYPVASMVCGSFRASDPTRHCPKVDPAGNPVQMLALLASRPGFCVDARDITTGLTALGEVVLRHQTGKEHPADPAIIQALLSHGADPGVALASIRQLRLWSSINLTQERLPQALDAAMLARLIDQGTATGQASSTRGTRRL